MPQLQLATCDLGGAAADPAGPIINVVPFLVIHVASLISASRQVRSFPTTRIRTWVFWSEENSGKFLGVILAAQIQKVELEGAMGVTLIDTMFSTKNLSNYLRHQPARVVGGTPKYTTRPLSKPERSAWSLFLASTITHLSSYRNRRGRRTLSAQRS